MAEWVESADELRLLLNLTRVSGVGGVRLRALIHRFGAPSAVVNAAVSDLSQLDGIDRERAEMIRRSSDLPFGEQQLTRLFEDDFKLITYWNPEYPDLLKHIDDPPVLLFVWGSFVPVDAFSIAVVGTRMPSRYGRQVTQHLVSEMVAAGITVVSGLARGIDTVAHAEAVKKGGRTLAVLGSGLDIIYPGENRKLAAAIAESGAVLSECPFGTKPDAVNFPRRNRIISGLALGTIVVEARERSGALITAAAALEQNREVFAVPGSIFSPQSRGCHNLIKEGAKPVSCIEDVLEEIPSQGELFSRREYARIFPAEVSEEEQKILEKLDYEPRHMDQISVQTGIAPAQLAELLLQLELKGFIRQLPGKFYIRS